MATIDISEVKRYIPVHIKEILILQELVAHIHAPVMALSHRRTPHPEPVMTGRFVKILRLRATPSVQQAEPNASSFPIPPIRAARISSSVLLHLFSHPP